MSRLVEQQLRQLSGNYKLTPATLAHRLNNAWIPSKHLMYISLEIAKAIAAGNARIILSMPPRHGKSELVTKYTTTWCLEQFPHWNTILATYGAELSTDFGRAVRDIINENPDLLNVRIRKDAAKVGNWKTEEGGGMAAVGVGGSITGRGANVFLIDDFIKDIKEAMSKANRDAIYDWFRTVATTRLEPGATMIIIATRWHYDDLIGRIVRYNPGGRWKNIKIPAIAEPNDPLGRAVGEPLFPERYSLEALQAIKEDLGSFFFNAMYQQNPKSTEDSMTNPEWLKFTDVMPNLANLETCRVWDLAATEAAGDWTVGAHMGYERNRNTTFLLNIVRRQLSPMQVEDLVRQTAISDGTKTKVYIEQEPGASGKALVEHFKNNVLPEFDVEAVPSGISKIEKAQPFLASCESGRFYCLNAPWNEAFVDEFTYFPSGDHDDQIDAVSIGYTKLTGKKSLATTWGRHNRGLVQPTAAEIDAVQRHKTGIVFGRR